MGTVRQSAPEQVLIKNGVPAYNLQSVSGPILNVKKLAAGRIDLFAFSVMGTFENIKKLGLNEDDYEVVYVYRKAPLYFAFNIHADDKVVNTFQKSINKLKRKDHKEYSTCISIIQRYVKNKQLASLLKEN